MSALTKILAGGVVAAALVGAAPAMAQYYPGYGGGYGGGAVIGQILSQVLSGGNGGYGGYGGGYGVNSQAAVSQCVSAVQARLNGGYGGGYGQYGNGGGYDGYSQYGNNGNRGARVLGISRVEQRSGGGLIVRGAASSGRYGGYNNGGQSTVDLTFKCGTDYRGMVTKVDIRPAQTNYGSNYSPYQGYGQSNGYGAYGNVQYGNSQYGNDYSQYGYSRY